MIRTKPASHRPLVGTRLHLEGCCTHALVFLNSRGALAKCGKCGSPCLQYTGAVQIAALSPDRFAIVRVADGCAQDHKASFAYGASACGIECLHRGWLVLMCSDATNACLERVLVDLLTSASIKGRMAGFDTL